MCLSRRRRGQTPADDLFKVLRGDQAQPPLLGRPDSLPATPQKSPDTPGSPEGNTEGPGTASSVRLDSSGLTVQVRVN